MIKWIIWTANNIGDSGARMISESLKTNTTLTALGLGSDEKWSEMKWVIIIIKKTKEWKNEMKNMNDDENTEEREIEMMMKTQYEQGTKLENQEKVQFAVLGGRGVPTIWVFERTHSLFSSFPTQTHFFN